MSIPSSPTNGSYLDPNSVLTGYNQWLAAGSTVVNSVTVTPAVRGVSYPTSQQVCVNLLSTHDDCGGTVGVSQVGQVGNIGGICDTSVLGSGSSSNPYVDVI